MGTSEHPAGAFQGDPRRRNPRFFDLLDEETHTLFAVQKLAAENTAAELRKTEIMQKWRAHMADIMEVNPDNSPVRVPLKPMFHQE